MTDIYGRDLDDDEIESIKKIIEGEGYEAVMKDVSEIKKIITGNVFGILLT